VTDWAASCMNTSTPPELHGRHFRHLQGHDATIS
jgi:hypothetical protein